MPTVNRHKHSGKWRTKIRHGENKLGQPHYEYRYFDGSLSKAEAEAEMRKAEYELQAGMVLPKSTELFGDFCRHRIETNRKVVPETRRNQLSFLKNYCGPIAHIPVSEMSKQRDTIREILWKMEMAGLKPNYRRACYDFISQMITDAVESDRCIKNPLIARKDRPAARDKTTEWDDAPQMSLDVGQVGEILDHLKSARFGGESALYGIVLFAVNTGLRRGEICGLKWEDFDFDNGVVYIVRQAKKNPNATGAYYAALKTPSSRRVVPIPPELVTYMRGRYAKALRDQLETGMPGKPEIVFPNRYGDLRVPETVSKEFGEMVKRVSFHTTLHRLRHTYTSNLVARGVDFATIANWIGHANTETLCRVYVHSMKEHREAQRHKIMMVGG